MQSFNMDKPGSLNDRAEAHTPANICTRTWCERVMSTELRTQHLGLPVKAAVFPELMRRSAPGSGVPP